MGKLIRNGIEYGGGNGTDIFKVTQAEYDALKQAGTLVHNALYVISDGDNLNPTASDIEYQSGVTVKQKIDSKQDTLTTSTGTITASSNVTLIRPNAIKWGKVKTLSCVFQVTGSTSTLGTIPSGFEPTNTIDFSVNGDSGHGCRLQIVAGNNTIAIASAPTQNEYYAFTVTYI